MDPYPLVLERRRPPTKEEFEKALLRLLESETQQNYASEQKSNKIFKSRKVKEIEEASDEIDTQPQNREYNIELPSIKTELNTDPDK